MHFDIGRLEPEDTIIFVQIVQYTIVHSNQSALLLNLSHLQPRREPVGPPLAQTSWFLTSGTTKFQPCSICYFDDLVSQLFPFQPQECFRHSFSPSSKPSKHNFQFFDLRIDSPILHSLHYVTCQLESRIVMLPRTMSKPQISTRQRYDGISFRVRKGDMCVVPRSINMKMMWLRLFLHLQLTTSEAVEREIRFI
jgi:hypothetical protein